MNFLFVDQILEFEPGKRALGIKHVTLHDYYLKPGLDNKVQLLSCIVGEALGQLGAWCVMYANDFTLRPVAGVVGEVNIYDEVYLGDSILLDTTIDSLTEEAILYHSTATVNGKTVFTIENGLGPFLPMQNFNDVEEVKQQFAMIYRPGVIPQIPTGTFNPTADTAAYHSMVFDKIISWEKGKEVVAQKNISVIAPFFVDHFPRKPVFPLSLLLECKLQLAHDFLTEHYGVDARRKFSAITLRKVKMNDFIQPGNVATTTLRLKEQTDDKVVLGFQTQVNDKRVCLAEAEFRIQ